MRTPLQAIRSIQKEARDGVTFPAGWCKRKCRQAYLIPSDGTGNAKRAYTATDHKFSGMWIPGAFAWWKVGENWHVAICSFRKGYVWTVDIPRVGHWNRVPLEYVTVKWNAKFLGFSRDIDGMTPVKVPRVVRRYP